MIVCVCGGAEADAFCEQHGFLVLAHYHGDLLDYSGEAPVLVTDQEMTREGYDRWKCYMFGRGVELISTKWTDDEAILRMLRLERERKNRRGGRQAFGFTMMNGETCEIPGAIEVARRIIGLRDAGLTYREIQDTEGITHVGGKRLSLSTIQVIVKNRELYEKG